MHWFVNLIEHHKDFFDLLIKGFGCLATVVGAAWIILKYFGDRKETRRTAELDLRRDAYAELFSALPLQRAAVGRFMGDGDHVEIPMEAYKALSKLHLLAANDALECLIAGNTIYHKGILELSSLKRDARQLQALADAGDHRMAEQAVNAWQRFRQRFKTLLVEMNANYRQLVPLARREIGMDGDDGAIVDALLKEQEAAIATLAQLES